MIGEKIVAIFFTLLILLILGRFNRYSYLFAPNAIIGRGNKNNAFALHLFFSVIIAGFIHIVLNEFFFIDKKLDQIPFLRILTIVAEFVIVALVIGIGIDAYFIATNDEYKKWKNEQST